MASRRGKSGAVDLAPAGRWIFLIGVAVSLLGGLYVALPSTTDPNVQTWLIYLLIVLGLVGGYLHVRKEDEHHFILISVALIVILVNLNPFSVIQDVTIGSSVVNFGDYITAMLQYFTVFLSMGVVGITFRNVIGWFRS